MAENHWNELVFFLGKYIDLRRRCFYSWFDLAVYTTCCGVRKSGDKIRDRPPKIQLASFPEKASFSAPKIRANWFDARTTWFFWPGKKKESSAHNLRDCHFSLLAPLLKDLGYELESSKSVSSLPQILLCRSSKVSQTEVNAGFSLVRPKITRGKYLQTCFQWRFGGKIAKNTRWKSFFFVRGDV